MNTKLWIRKATSTGLMVAVLATYSMVALANEAKATGELIVNGNSVVTVNGEAAKSGRTIFTSSMISTPVETGATINLGQAGAIELGVNTSATVSFDAKAVSVNLSSGTLTVLRSASPVNVNAAGTTRVLNAGETVTATAKGDDRNSDGKCIDTDKDGDEECSEGGAWWLWALVFGGAAAGVLIAATQSGNNQFGGGGTVVSPNR